MCAKKLSVRLHGIEVGILEETDNGKMRFKYNEDAKHQLSLSLPIRKEVYSEKECRGYFGGLLPENASYREIFAKKYKISPNSDFALLKAIGHECAGAVSFREIGEKTIIEFYNSINCKLLSKYELVKMIKELPLMPYLGRRMSLAGAQEKTAVTLLNGRICIPLDNMPTTHILKPANKSFEQSVQNEYMCMKAAKLAGLNVAEVEMRNVDGVEFLLIKRFDRHDGDDGTIRVQQEDFAQACGVWAKDKYDFTFKDCCKVLEQLDTPIIDKDEFIKCAIFNYLISNNDAHAKNFSLFLTGKIKLTPFYDILCTAAYDELDNDMAMKIGSAKYAKDVGIEDWVSFANDLDVSPKLVFDELKIQSARLPKIFEQLAQELNVEIGYKISEIVKKNCLTVQKRLAF